MLLTKTLENLEEIVQEESTWKSKKVLFFFSDTIIKNLQLAILSGEHYEENAGELLTRISSIIADVYFLLFEIKTKKFSWADIDIETLKKSIQECQNLYLFPFESVINTVSRNLESLLTGDDGITVDVRTFEGYNILQELPELLSLPAETEAKISNFYLFHINLLLACLDDYLECSDVNILMLQNVLSFLEERVISKDEVTSLLADKARFLQYKINYRNSRPRNDEEPDDHNRSPIIIDQEENAYASFITEILDHTNGNFNPRILLAEIQSFKKEAINDIRLAPFHHLNRYYTHKITDVAERKRKITILLDKLDELNDNVSDLSRFDQIAFRSFHKLLSNSRLRAELDLKKESDFKILLQQLKGFIEDGQLDTQSTILDETFDQISLISSEHNFTDYYCYVVFIKFLNEFLNFLINNPSKLVETVDPSIDEAILKRKTNLIINYISEKYLLALSQLKIILRQLMTHKVKPVSLMQKECEIDYTFFVFNGDDDEETDVNNFVEGHLFLDSSYILPINFDRINQKIQSWSSFLTPQLNHLRDAFEITFNQIIIKKNISSFNSQMDKKTAELKKKMDENEKTFLKQVKDNEFKLVQIVAMFVSIATFVLINVKIFDNKTALESFGLILGLAACFFLFNFFFYILLAYQNRAFDEEDDINKNPAELSGNTMKGKSKTPAWKKRFGPFYRRMITIGMLPIIFLSVSFYFLHTEKSVFPSQVETLSRRVFEDSVKIERLKLNEEKLSSEQQLQKMIIDTTFKKNRLSAIK